MRNAVRAALSISALAMSGVAFGQTTGTGIPGIDFGTKPIDTTCNFGENCKVIAGGGLNDNFVQRQFVVSGKTYIQTLITDPGNQGTGQAAFNSEDYVQLQTGNQGSVQGIASQMTIGTQVPDKGTGFYTSSSIKSGWANNGGETQAIIQLDLGSGESSAGANDYFVSRFNVDTNFNAGTNKNTLNSLSIAQDLGLGTAAGATGGTLPKQEFVTIVTSATNPQAQPVALVGDPVQQGITWQAGDRIQATWVGQDMNAFGAGVFGLENMQNIQDPTNKTITFASNLSNPNPVNWQGATPVMAAEFGTPPTF